MSVKEKKVELIELFYDLIYVYAISNMTLLLEEPEGGILTWDMFATYIVASMVIIQAWLYMTN
ncbi:MAG: low temperature requirement protein A, partial [Candidatus Methanomethylophilaceae archaeon]|nr:low temperature requirement protein A [Candidatus Methanomethylophilaceae archaeon]